MPPRPSPAARRGASTVTPSRSSTGAPARSSTRSPRSTSPSGHSFCSPPIMGRWCGRRRTELHRPITASEPTATEGASGRCAAARGPRSKAECACRPSSRGPGRSRPARSLPRWRRRSTCSRPSRGWPGRNCRAIDPIPARTSPIYSAATTTGMNASRGRFIITSVHSSRPYGSASGSCSSASPPIPSRRRSACGTSTSRS